MDARRFVEFVVTSKVWTGAELLQRLGPADEPVETIGETAGQRGALRVISESTWVARAGMPETAEIEDQLAALHERVDAALGRIRKSGRAPIVGLLRVVQYLPGSEWQGHGFAVGREWIAILSETHGSIDIDQYVISGGDS